MFEETGANGLRRPSLLGTISPEQPGRLFSALARLGFCFSNFQPSDKKPQWAYWILKRAEISRDHRPQMKWATSSRFKDALNHSTTMHCRQMRYRGLHQESGRYKKNLSCRKLSYLKDGCEKALCHDAEEDLCRLAGETTFEGWMHKVR